MAPELIDPDDSHTRPTSRSDVYSFGSIMFQVCNIVLLAPLVTMIYEDGTDFERHCPL